VIEFYNAGGGVGLGLTVPHQTLPSTPLNLTNSEKEDLISFMQALTDTTFISAAPQKLPRFSRQTALNKRAVGGRY
jgi:cytochrome c peroxidase